MGSGVVHYVVGFNVAVADVVIMKVVQGLQHAIDYFHQFCLILELVVAQSDAVLEMLHQQESIFAFFVEEEAIYLMIKLCCS